MPLMESAVLKSLDGKRAYRIWIRCLSRSFVSCESICSNRGKAGEVAPFLRIHRCPRQRNTPGRAHLYPEATVHRELKLARAWLRHELRHELRQERKE
jgi:hypothetical protein